MNKNNIELSIIEKKIDISSMNTIELINFIILEVENVKQLYKKGQEKKQLVLNIVDDFLRDPDNIFSKSNNHQVIFSLLNLNNNKLISDIIDNIIYCANGNLNIKNNKSKCFSCFHK